MPDRIAKNLVAAALELHRRRTWRKVPCDAPFLIRIPDEDEPLAAVLIGQDGSELGLVVMPGPNALGQVRRLFLEGAPAGVASDEGGFLSVTFERLGAIPDVLRGVLNAAGFQTRRESIAPFLFYKPAHRRPRRLNRKEMRTLVWCLGGIFAAEDTGELRPTAQGSQSKVLQLDVGGKPRAPEVTTRFVTPPVEDVVIGMAPVLLPADLRELPRLEVRWIVGLALLPRSVEGDERTMHALLIVDEESELVVGANVIPGGELSEAVAAMADTMRGQGLPREIVFTSEALLDCVAPGLAVIGVPSSLDVEEPLWWEAASGLVEGLGAGQPPPDDPQTLEDWKQVDAYFTQQFVGDLLKRELLTPRAATRYFGSEEAAVEVQRELQQLSVAPAFIEWLAADYRPTKRSRTYIEKQLERKGLGPAERKLLCGRRDALLSFYRVHECVPGASLDVEDLLSGERFTVQDAAMSNAGLEGWFLPLRLMRIDDWYFPCVAGPPINALHITRVLAWLEYEGLTLEPGALRADAHLVGRTWAWFLEQRESSVELQNTDGDPIEWHTAQFDVADPAALASAFEGRDDVIVDEPGAEWTWVRAGGVSDIGDGTTLCRLQLIGDALIAEVNSACRLESACAWIETLGCARFVSARQSDFADVEERPLDDRLPGPPPEELPPEIRAELERHIEQRVMGWLDESVPALDGLTPRAACSTEAGRGRVARMIRAMPGIQTPGGEIPPPRERLLRELGL